jgi:hypothetical protein
MFEMEFRAKDGNSYTIKIDDIGERIEVSLQDVSLGQILLEYRYDPPIELEHFYINDLALNKCRGKGLGEAALSFHIEQFGLPIVAAREHGSKREDGSHLIEDGVHFIRRMREKGIVCPEPEERD